MGRVVRRPLKDGADPHALVHLHLGHLVLRLPFERRPQRHAELELCGAAEVYLDGVAHPAPHWKRIRPHLDPVDKHGEGQQGSGLARRVARRLALLGVAEDGHVRGESGVRARCKLVARRNHHVVVRVARAAGADAGRKGRCERLHAERVGLKGPVDLDGARHLVAASRRR